MGAGGGAAASGVLAAELCAPLLLLCWLCCWPDDTSESSSSGHPRKPVIASEGRRRSGGLRARLAGSAVSLHLPGTSTGSPARSVTGSLAAPTYRSHEELNSHSAPGVIREVLLRRDWDRSARDLYIPLRPDPDALSSPATPPATPATPDTPPAPRATPDSLSDETPETPRCKKHHSNIKSSRGKERRPAAERDEESPSRFYIGDDVDNDRVEGKSLRPEKEEKQCLNESIRSKERLWRLVSAPDGLEELDALDALEAPDGQDRPDTPDTLDTPDRSGAVHHTLDSRAAMGYFRVATLSPISVDVVGYEYEGEGGAGDERARGAALAGAPPAARARHASDGDILAPAPRPESGAFSESDLDLELRLALQAGEQREARGARGERACGDARETAI